MKYCTLKLQAFALLVLFVYLPEFSFAQTGEIVVDGFHMAYEEKGDGETIFFVHGAQEDFRSFGIVTEFLKSAYRTISYSRTYNYPNNYPYDRNRDFSAASEATLLAGAIEKLGEGPVHLVGHSFGGLIAIQLALERPELIKSLTLSEPALISWLPEIVGCESWAGEVKEHLINDTRIAYARGDSTEVMKELLEFFVGQDVQNEMPPEIMQPLWDNLEEMHAIVFARDAFTHVEPQELADLAMPMFLITTGKSMPMLQCTNEALTEALPEAAHAHFPEEGHELWLTAPEEVAKTLTDFINEN